MFDMVLLKFLAQGAAIDAETGRGLGLVVVAVPQHGLQHGLLNFSDDRIKKVARELAIEIFQVRLNRFFNRLL